MAEFSTVSYKLVLLGDTSVGKSSVVGRFVKNEFLEYQQPTIGAAFLTQTVDLGTHVCKFEIWDTAGQERYRSLAPMYYRGAGAACVVYDITNKLTFAGAKKWIQELQNQGDPDVVIALCGNKSDLNVSRKVTAEEARDYADQQGILFYETSAKTGANIQEAFRSIAEKLPSQPKGAGADRIEIIGQPATSRGCC